MFTLTPRRGLSSVRQPQYPGMRQLKFPLNPRLLPSAGDPARCRGGLEDWLEKAAEWPDDVAAFARDLAADDKGRRLLEAVFGNSPYLGLSLIREVPFLRSLLDDGADEAFDALLAGMQAELGAEMDMAALMRGLRIAKRRAALLIALADIAGIWPLERITLALSRFADQSTSLAARHLLRRAAAEGDLTLPYPEDPERDSGLIVIGMGKLGAFELNYSSDIDLIVFYDEERITYTGRRSVQECFVRLTRDLVKILDERTVDGYVFRTDLRLRPDPGSTPAAISLLAAETYYEGFGQNWERAAMIKARQVAGDRQAGSAFLRFLKPFIWRKSLDFAAIQDIHSIKRQINAHRGGKTIAVAGHNIKLGRGGIREIEFFAQTQQLIWGGRQPEVRSSNTVEALRALAAAGHIGETVADEMIAAYGQLRTLEHRLQMIDDKQTQTLPTAPEALAQISAFFGCADTDAFDARVRGILQTVEGHYAQLFEDAPELSGGGGNLVFTGGENDPETLKTIAALGYQNPDVVASQIRGWHHGRVRATRSTRARELLTELTPALLAALARTAAPDAAFLKFDDFLSRLPAGVPLFSLFWSNPTLLELVAEIMGDAPRLAEHLSHNPTLLDSVLTQGFFGPPPPPEALAADIDRALGEAGDYQEVLDAARRWTNDRKFQIGVLMLRNRIDPVDASRALADVADSVLSRLHPHVEAEFARNHGRIPGAGFAIVAMGKMGSREMTATSDLDLILVYDTPPDVDGSDGPRPLAPSVYFARLTQRMLNAITAKTSEGALYEVDMRLRPSGNAGPIASSLEAFVRYHDEMAWTWEHMALTRARIISGPDALARRIEEVIRKTLTRRRDADKLLADVADMRERMAREHKGESPWEVKHRRGGLIDIDFIAQYLQLRHAADHPEVLAVESTRVIERCASAGLLDAEDAAILRRALRLWVTVQGVLRQTIEGSFVEDTAPEGLRSILVTAAGLDDFEALKQRMTATAVSVQEIYNRLIDRPARLSAATKEETQ